MTDSEVVQRFEHYDWVSAPAVDAYHKLLRRITIDDVVDVIIFRNTPVRRPMSDDFDFDFDTTAERPSKSARKREDQQLQQLAAALLELPATELASIPLGPELGAALEATRAITQREARRRQLQYLGKLVRNADHPAIRAALDGLRMRQRQFRRHLQRIDRLCEELIAGGDTALAALLNEPGPAATLDRQQLRQLLRKATQANAPEGARRKLFDYLRQHLL